MKFINNNTTSLWAFVAFVTLFVTACGGSSSTAMTPQERATSQTAELKDAYDKAKAALDTLQDDTSDATEAEVVAVEEALKTLKEKIAAAKDVSDEVKAMYPASTIEAGLAEAREAIKNAIGNKAVLDAIVKTAETASTNADTAAKGAETATTDIVIIQAPEAKSVTYTQESRAAAKKAMEEYEKARTAAAAGNRANAEAARREAERQAKIAADKAAEAKKVAAAAGSKELKFSGGAYRVGDVSIKPEGGVTRDQLSTIIARTPLTALQVTASRNSDLYKYICSADNGQRDCETASTNAIELFTKYNAPKKTTVYRRLFSTVQITGNVGAVSTENEYGTVAFSGNTYPVDKEDGEFYEVDRKQPRPPHPYTGYDPLEAGQLTRANVRSSELVDDDDRNAEEATGIYSFTPEEDITINAVTFAAGQKVYLKRDGTTAGKPDYKIISIFRDVTIPVSTPYEHMNYGLWVNYESDTSATQADMGIGFVRTLAGKSMTPDMPTAGIVTYHGHGVINTRIRNSHPETGIRGDIGTWRTYTATTADFGRNKISVDFGGPLATDVVEFQLEGDISGNGFSGTTVTVPTGGGFPYDYGTGGAVEGVHSELQPGGSFTGTFKGNFFGPGAAEVGGVFDFTSEDNKDGGFRGAFGGVKSFSTE